jgi:L-ribulose-5-phosphate 3-epimerase
MRNYGLSRREFVQSAALGGAALGLSLSLERQSFGQDVSGKPKSGKIGDYKISLAQWSLHKRLFANPTKLAEMNLDFPKFAKEEFGIDGVEFVNQFFKDKPHDEAYLKDLKKRISEYGVTPVLIMIDGEGDLSSAKKEDRTKAVENHKRWVDAAATLGCHAIRVNTGENYSPTNVEAAVDGCGALTDYGKSKGIAIICENHGGPSSNPDSLIALIKGVNKPEFGTLPDFGNFPKKAGGVYEIDVYEAIARMMPYAHGVSAKSYDFSADGMETTLDYPRIMKIVTDSGYKGFVGIEYEGGRLSEPDGIRATKSLLEKLRGSEYKA